jgi:hypothetical protein
MFSSGFDTGKPEIQFGHFLSNDHFDRFLSNDHFGRFYLMTGHQTTTTAIFLETRLVSMAI